MEDRTLESSAMVSIPAKAGSQMEMLGLQLSLLFDEELVFQGIQPGVLDLGESNYHLIEDEGRLNISWNSLGKGQVFDQDDILFHLRMTTPLTDLRLSESIYLDDGGLMAEAIDHDLTTYNTTLEFDRSLGDPLAVPVMKVFDNRPNPFRDETTISFEITVPAEVTIEFFDLSGRRLFTRTQDFQTGQNEITVTADDLQRHPGVIIYRVSTPWAQEAKKLTLVK